MSEDVHENKMRKRSFTMEKSPLKKGGFVSLRTELTQSRNNGTGERNGDKMTGRANGEMMIENSYSPPRRVSKTQMGHHTELARHPTFRETESYIFNTFMEKKRDMEKKKGIPVVNFEQNAMINVQKMQEEASEYFYQDAKSPDGSKPTMRKVVSDQEDFLDHSMSKHDNGFSGSK